jgi:methylphosphotriester-DNA--protein-cysteine methyltransferase
MTYQTCTEAWLRSLAASLGIDRLPDGWLYGVRSTGIACRPGCRSRAPLAANVVLPLSPESAKTQGFRPCRRCRPYR